VEEARFWGSPLLDVRIAVSHPCARKKAQRWGMEFCGGFATEKQRQGPEHPRALPLSAGTDGRKKRGQAQRPIPFHVLISYRSVIRHQLSTQILNVDVSAEAGVVGEIETRMVGVFVNHDVITIPEPSVDIGHIPGRYAPVPVVEPEATGIAAAEAPSVPRTEAAVPTAVLPWMIDAVVLIVAASVVANPVSSIIHVRRIGMVGLIAEVSPPVAVVVAMAPVAVVVLTAPVRRPLMIVFMIGRWTTGGRLMLSAVLTLVPVISFMSLMLGKCGDTQDQQCR